MATLHNRGLIEGNGCSECLVDFFCSSPRMLGMCSKEGALFPLQTQQIIDEPFQRQPQQQESPSSIYPVPPKEIISPSSLTSGTPPRPPAYHPMALLLLLKNPAHHISGNPALLNIPSLPLRNPYYWSFDFLPTQGH